MSSALPSLTVDGLLDEFEKLCYGIYVLRDATPKAMAKVSSLGERMCADPVRRSCASGCAEHHHLR